MESDISPNIQSTGRMSDPLLNERENFFKRTKRSAGEVLSISCMLVLFIGLIIVISAIPIVQVIMGSLYKDSCPINYLIPIYLIVAGCTTLTLLIVSIMKIIMEKSIIWSFLQIILMIFCFGWFITGNVWIFTAKKHVQFIFPHMPSTYCDYSVFNCAYGTLFISYGFLAGTVCYGSKRST